MSKLVREMFSQIAPRYDVANEVLFFGIHRLWRRAAVRLSGALTFGTAYIYLGTVVG